MEKMTPFNPMPETLEDTKLTPNIVTGPAQAGADTIQLPEQPTQKRKEQIDAMLASKLTGEAINKEILNEKIRNDIDSVKERSEVKSLKNPRDVLKTLISIGDYKETVEMFGHKWTLRALNQGDISLAFSDVTEDTTTTAGRVSVLITSQIAYAIEACDGVSIYEWFPDLIQRNQFATTEDFKLATRRILRQYLTQMPNSVINQFNDEYNKIEEKRNEAVDKLKNA